MKHSHYPTVRPAADIMDTEEGVRIVANMPGVRADGLHLELEGHEIHIHASSRCPSPRSEDRDLRNLEFGNVEYELDIVMESPLSAPPLLTLDKGVLSVFLPAEDKSKVRFV